MASIVAVESSDRPLAIHDNTSERSFLPDSRRAAVVLATKLVKRGDSVDMGLTQINSGTLGTLDLTPREAFDPCRNLRASAKMLSKFYDKARARYGPGQIALRRALGAYNTGSLGSGDAYARHVVTTAKRLPTALATSVPAKVPAIAGSGSKAPSDTKAAAPVHRKP